MPLSLTSTYVALLSLLFLVLSTRVILYRRAQMISLGDQGDKNLIKRMRAQANWVEYAPLGLILLALTEINGAPAIAVHLLGIALLSGRVLHAAGFAATPQKIILRQIGMLLTLGMIALSALGLLGHALL